MQAAIRTLTVNPALDVWGEVERLEPVRKLRVTNLRVAPGGGGVNVARAVRRLGGEAVAVYARGGATGARFDDLMQAQGVTCEPVAVRGETRESFTVYDRATSQEYRLVLPGPALSEPEWRAVLAAASAPADYLVASGSLPPGAPSDFFARAAEAAKARGVRFVLDTSGAALAEGLKAGVWLAKPSLEELENAVGAKLDGSEAQTAAARDVVLRGDAEVLLLSLSERGAILITREQILRLPAPAIEPRCSVGAGDSMVAAMVLSLARGAPLDDAFRLAVAAGSAALLGEAGELCRREDVERLEAELRTSRPSAR